MSSHNTVSLISEQSTMPPATNSLIHYGSSQTESLGDACLISVLASVTMVLRVIDFYVKNTNKIKWRQTTY